MKIAQKDSITEEYYEAVSDLLYQHNLKNTVHIDSINKPLEMIIQDNEKIAGGLYGRSIWGTLEIHKLAVSEDYKGRGLGKQLIKAAIEEGKARKCDYISLQTFSFQAPEFYEKLGFVRIGIETDFPKGFEKYYYRKSLL
ncbi:GNAT family N-acetyltransferase [Chryseobacterium rhizosphaerae]|uniref:N-acetyltransferase n=1 Tax=Chryseobacterium rhizosphaerae TaxID=395937 RepID=A0ABX9IH43_9FLAO|nr:GNAT family N-acetyltransferase [Chryseobacterium rhizosphaerae]REC73087.1 N-acetyltransferase [Chryseobacterium rhizosphaerae]GEN67697.1 N-acetyltransferase [Chryseobacterium rhizosphaerae]